MSLLNIFDVAGSGMAAQSARLNTTASNMANADSVSSSEATAYRAKQPMFSAVQQQVNGQMENAGVRAMGVTESQAPVQSRYEPANPMADTNGYVYSSNVNPVDELVNMISASRSYQNNVEVMNSAKQLMQKTLDLGK
ncbi:flagellar basal body rod protein FlgC [Luteibacter anthropi]|uniref:Flagellar basal-body rod protein FlgC n=1 Tax=Luteibacter anthropi TaxID=564369 RepID=A0A7X5UC67_9GAMM|nr:flagellar basal body rod protein FlgC [Luteibacter anthropi]NII07629.1 flagellar basal body rod protein FlgC [Luteibacter anthropi]URX60931.1 flagellar basal body rod protein FlgC [Luteibacter anthropi]